MTIDNFSTSMRIALTTFVAHWQFMHEGTTELWPLEMKEEEWHEQWIAYLGELQDRKLAALEEQE